MKNLVKVFGIIAVVAVIIGLAGCATTIPIDSVRKPTIDTSSVQRLAIKGFENKSGTGGNLGAQLTNYLNDKVNQAIPSYGYFNLVNANDPNAEGLFVGEIRAIQVKNSQSEVQRKDKEGNPYTVTVYRRDVGVEFRYDVISTRTQMSVGTFVSKSGTQYSTSEQQSSLTDELVLARGIVDSQLRTLKQDIVPTIVTTHKKLMKEQSKDKVVKQRMKEAEALVKNKVYGEAIRVYEEIASEFNSSAARVNANMIKEAIALSAAAQAQLAELYSDTDGLAEKAAKSAVDTLNSKLPSRAILMIQVTGTDQRNMLDYVVEQMEKAIVQGRMTLVDRTNMATISEELQHQLSGNVSDDSAVSIGKQLGAQYIVLCGVSGDMSNRRLTVRVLDIEKATLVDTSTYDI